jgi:uncharacterized protein (UPF0332 family)
LTGPNKELVAYRMSRADETLEDARILASAERWNACVNRLYYACFYAISALLLSDGLSSTRHSGIRGLFKGKYVKPEPFPVPADRAAEKTVDMSPVSRLFST